DAHALDKPVVQLSDRALEDAARALSDWPVPPSGTLGYNKAEVTLGGVDTRGLSSKTMEANVVRGLYFIGEGVDVTGHLGGFNFQWAWASRPRRRRSYLKPAARRASRAESPPSCATKTAAPTRCVAVAATAA